MCFVQETQRGCGDNTEQEKVKNRCSMFALSLFAARVCDFNVEHLIVFIKLPMYRDFVGTRDAPNKRPGSQRNSESTVLLLRTTIKFAFLKVKHGRTLDRLHQHGI